MSDSSQKSTSPPRFLWGVFDWHENGYHWNCPPPADLLEDQALVSPEPWLRIAAVVARAREGDFSEVHRLRPFMEDAHHPDVCWVAWRLYGSTAPSHALHVIEQALTGYDPELRQFAAQSAEICGFLKLIPAMLEAWSLAETIGDRETIGFAVSSLLERDAGPLVQQANIYRLEDRLVLSRDPETSALTFTRTRGLDEDEPMDFLGLAVEAYNDLSARLGQDAVILHGGPCDVLDIAGRLLDAMQERHPLGLLDLRYRFESMTGIDCRRFFYGSKPQRLLITDAVSTFLESSVARGFTPGRRYFFGHPVP